MQRLQFRRHDPARHFVLQPKPRSIQILRKPPRRRSRLSHIVHISNGTRLRLRVDRNAVRAVTRVIVRSARIRRRMRIPIVASLSRSHSSADSTGTAPSRLPGRPRQTLRATLSWRHRRRAAARRRPRFLTAAVGTPNRATVPPPPSPRLPPSPAYTLPSTPNTAPASVIRPID